MIKNQYNLSSIYDCSLLQTGYYGYTTAIIPDNTRITYDDMVIRQLHSDLKDFIIIDTETTSRSTYEAEIIQISALKFINDKLVDSFNQFVKPDDLPLNPIISSLTGITDDMLVNCPPFEQVIEPFLQFTGDELPWIGHNINMYDIHVLKNNGLPINQLNILDTVKLAKEKFPNMKHVGLAVLKDYFGIQLPSHNALDDCKTNAIIYKKLRDNQLKQVIIHHKQTHELDGLRFAITGVFRNYSRQQLKELIQRHGGRVTTSVSKKTNYVVAGTQTALNLTDPENDKSAKMINAEKYGIPIISLEELTKMAK